MAQMLADMLNHKRLDIMQCSATVLVHGKDLRLQPKENNLEVWEDLETNRLLNSSFSKV